MLQKHTHSNKSIDILQYRVKSRLDKFSGKLKGSTYLDNNKRNNKSQSVDFGDEYRFRKPDLDVDKIAEDEEDADIDKINKMLEDEGISDTGEENKNYDYDDPNKVILDRRDVPNPNIRYGDEDSTPNFRNTSPYGEGYKASDYVDNLRINKPQDKLFDTGKYLREEDITNKKLGPELAAEVKDLEERRKTLEGQLDRLANSEEFRKIDGSGKDKVAQLKDKVKELERFFNSIDYPDKPGSNRQGFDQRVKDVNDALKQKGIERKVPYFDKNTENYKSIRRLYSSLFNAIDQTQKEDRVRRAEDFDARRKEREARKQRGQDAKDTDSTSLPMPPPQKDEKPRAETDEEFEKRRKEELNETLNWLKQKLSKAEKEDAGTETKKIKHIKKYIDLFFEIVKQYERNIKTIENAIEAGKPIEKSNIKIGNVIIESVTIDNESKENVDIDELERTKAQYERLSNKAHDKLDKLKEARDDVENQKTDKIKELEKQINSIQETIKRLEKGRTGGPLENRLHELEDRKEVTKEQIKKLNEELEDLKNDKKRYEKGLNPLKNWNDIRQVYDLIKKKEKEIKKLGKTIKSYESDIKEIKRMLSNEEKEEVYRKRRTDKNNPGTKALPFGYDHNRGFSRAPDTLPNKYPEETQEEFLERMQEETQKDSSGPRSFDEVRETPFEKFPSKDEEEGEEGVEDEEDTDEEQSEKGSSSSGKGGSGKGGSGKNGSANKMSKDDTKTMKLKDINEEGEEKDEPEKVKKKGIGEEKDEEDEEDTSVDDGKKSKINEPIKKPTGLKELLEEVGE